VFENGTVRAGEFVGSDGFAQGQEVIERAVELELEAGLIAVDERELARARELAEGSRHAAELVAGALGVDGVGQQAILDGPTAARFPPGGAHIFDEADFDIVGGLEAAVEGVGQILEAGLGLGGEDHGGGEHAVANGVLGRAALPFSGCRPVRQPAVFLRSFDTSFGTHKAFGTEWSRFDDITRGVGAESLDGWKWLIWNGLAIYEVA
jgi:hypothetical protein